MVRAISRGPDLPDALNVQREEGRRRVQGDRSAARLHRSRAFGKPQQARRLGQLRQVHGGAGRVPRRKLAVGAQVADDAMDERQVDRVQRQVVPEAVQPRGPHEDPPRAPAALHQRRRAVVEAGENAAVADLERADTEECGPGEVAGTRSPERLEDGVVVVHEAQVQLSAGQVEGASDGDGQKVRVGRWHPTPFPERDEKPASGLHELAQSSSSVAAGEGGAVQNDHVACCQDVGAGRAPRDPGRKAGPVRYSQGAAKVQIGLAAAQRVHDRHLHVAAGRRDEVERVVGQQRVVGQPELAPGEGAGQREGSEDDRGDSARRHGHRRSADFGLVHQQGDLGGDVLRRNRAHILPGAHILLGTHILPGALASRAGRHHSGACRHPFPAARGLPAQLQARQCQVGGSRGLVADHQRCHRRAFGENGVAVGAPSGTLEVADDRHASSGQLRRLQHRSRELDGWGDPGGQRSRRQRVQRLGHPPGLGGGSMQQDRGLVEGDQRHPVRRSQRVHDRSGHGHALFPVVVQPHGVRAVQQHDDLFGARPPDGGQPPVADKRTGEGEDDERERCKPNQQKHEVAQAQARPLPEGNPLQEHERRKRERLASLPARQVEQHRQRQARQRDQEERGEEAHCLAGALDRAFTEPWSSSA